MASEPEMVFCVPKYIFSFAGAHSKIAYIDVNEKIEKLTKLFAVNEITAIIVGAIPALLITIVNYIWLDLGKESYNLYFFTWFVP